MSWNLHLPSYYRLPQSDYRLPQPARPGNWKWLQRPAELEDYITVCERHGVLTHTVQAGLLDLSTPSGRLVARQLGAVARYE